jgi:hypothetical protein
MVFATVAIGEERISTLLHLLNDMRNVGEKIYVLTNLEVDLDFYFFDNVVLVKTEKDWSTFRELELIRDIFLTTDETVVYKLDLDSRLFDFRHEKYNKQKFAKLIDSINFDVLYSWSLGSAVNARWHLRPPEENENKDVRNYTYGHPEVISHLKKKLPCYEDLLDKESILESVLIFKRGENVINFLTEVAEVGELIETCDKKIGRKHWAHSSGFVMGMYADYFNINFVKSDLTYHYFKPNFLTEVFLWRWNMSKEVKLYNE